MAVPQADMEEILPAARLLSRATAVTPSDYDRAKTLFLAGLHDAGMQAQVSAALPYTYSNTAPFVVCHMQAQGSAALLRTHSDTASPCDLPHAHSDTDDSCALLHIRPDSDLFVICHMKAQWQRTRRL